MLTEAQQLQITKQLEAHHHDEYTVDLELAQGEVLKGFVVHQQVMRPEVMSTIYLARYLCSHQELYRGKKLLDMGCGSGIQGIVAGVYGATQVTCSDISSYAVRNTRENVKRFSLEDRVGVVQGDLFEHISDTANVIVCNHPFFADNPIEEAPVSIAMLNNGEFLRRFLAGAHHYLTTQGVIVMPFFHFAGPTNNPALHAPTYGYRVDERWSTEITTGLQQGRLSIYELSYGET